MRLSLSAERREGKIGDFGAASWQRRHGLREPAEGFGGSPRREAWTTAGLPRRSPPEEAGVASCGAAETAHFQHAPERHSLAHVRHARLQLFLNVPLDLLLRRLGLRVGLLGLTAMGLELRALSFGGGGRGRGEQSGE